MANWEDWRYVYRKYIIADISSPTRIPEEYKNSNHQIKLFSELYRADVEHTDCMEIIRLTMLPTFNYIHQQNFSFDDAIGKHKDNINFD